MPLILAWLCSTTLMWTLPTHQLGDEFHCVLLNCLSMDIAHALNGSCLTNPPQTANRIFIFEEKNCKASEETERCLDKNL